MSDYITISRDPFGRSTFVRRIVSVRFACQWCNRVRMRFYPSIGRREPLGTIFQYGTVRDDRARVEWHAGYFCSKGCHDSFHGG